MSNILNWNYLDKISADLNITISSHETLKSQNHGVLYFVHITLPYYYPYPFAISYMWVLYHLYYKKQLWVCTVKRSQSSVDSRCCVYTFLKALFRADVLSYPMSLCDQLYFQNLNFSDFRSLNPKKKWWCHRSWGLSLWNFQGVTKFLFIDFSPPLK